jgi:hypothetical protein
MNKAGPTPTLYHIEAQTPAVPTLTIIREEILGPKITI